MDRHPRPAITVIGQVRDDGVAVTVSGWTLGYCLRRCSCHRREQNAVPQLVEGEDGSLGLKSWWPGCSCCRPWSPDELAAVARDAAYAASIPTTA